MMWNDLILFLGSAVVNAVVISFFAGRYTNEVRNTTKEVAYLRTDLDSVVVEVAFIRGKLNGRTYKESNQ